MRKLLSALIIAFMAVGFAACDDKKESSPSEKATTEFCNLCDRVIKAIENQDGPALFEEIENMTKFQEKYSDLKKDDFTSEQRDRIYKAISRTENVAENAGIDLDQLF